MRLPRRRAYAIIRRTMIRPLFIVMLMALPASAADFELLGQPCRSFNVLAGRVITDAAGKEQLVLTNMNENSGCELIFIDLASGTGKTYRAPAGAGSWALDEVPGKRLIVGTYFDGMFMVFDL